MTWKESWGFLSTRNTNDSQHTRRYEVPSRIIYRSGSLVRRKTSPKLLEVELSCSCQYPTFLAEDISAAGDRRNSPKEIRSHKKYSAVEIDLTLKTGFLWWSKSALSSQTFRTTRTLIRWRSLSAKHDLVIIPNRSWKRMWAQLWHGTRDGGESRKNSVSFLLALPERHSLRLATGEVKRMVAITHAEFSRARDIPEET